MDADEYENWTPFELALADVLHAGVSEDDVVGRVRSFAAYERDLAAERRSTPTGWYYLHANGELIYRSAAHTTVSDMLESDLVVAFWPIDDPGHPDDREQAWTLLVEALAGGADPVRVRELADGWSCGAAGAEEYAARIGFSVVAVGDGIHWVAAAGEQCGAGHSALEAIADLAKTLGYWPSKAPDAVGFGTLVGATVSGGSR